MTRIKICGITRAADAQLAVALGASALGFIFWPGSARFIDPHRARPIVGALPPGVAPVGVFVDQPPEYVAAVSALLALGAVQLHGSEDLAAYSGLRTRLVKAVPVPAGAGMPDLSAIPPPVTVLLDAHDPVRRGGTGRTIDWGVAAAIAASRPTILSGGLTPDNVSEAIARVHPYMIDVSSGVEHAPGIKDEGRLRAFFERARGARAADIHL